MSRGFLLPRFGHEYWARIGVPTKAGETKVVASSDTFIRDRRLFDVLDPRFRIIAREAKPSMWAHAETFREILAAYVNNDNAEAEEFQVWAGLLTAVFQGDLEVVRFGREMLTALDEDLYPALRASLPITPDPVQWPEILYNLHGNSGLTVIRTGDDGAIVGACYAPCLVFPALQHPAIAQDRRLEKFQVGKSERPNFRLTTLMERYSIQDGFSQAFDSILSKLVDQLRARERSSLFLDLQNALSLLRRVLRERYAAGARVPKLAAKPHQTSFLGYVYENLLEQKFRGAGAGNIGFWEVYPLRTTIGEKPVLLIPEGIDLALNPWAEAPAFPGSPDVHTRLCDLSIHSNPGKGTVEVWGKDGKVYEVSKDFHLLSLHPQAPSHLRVVLDALFYLEGEDNALDPSLLDSIHSDWRRDLTTREDITPLVPLHTNLLKLFPEYITRSKTLVTLSSGSVGDSTAADAVCRLTLPLPVGERFNGFRTFTWRTRLIGWKLDETRLPTADVWPSFQGQKSPHWSAYFVRTLSSPGKLTLFFHGEKGIRERPQQASLATMQTDSLYIIDRLSSPPRLAEVVSAASANPGPLGLIFISSKTYKEIFPSLNRWRTAVDFGTSNTSVAIQEGEGANPAALEFRPWAAPLLYPISARLTPPEPYPGWFLQGPRSESFHRGFFPTLLGYRKAQALNQDLLKTLANPAGQKSEEFGDLIGSFDLLGIKGYLALLIDAAKTLSPHWGIEDNLKWASPGESAESEQRRKAFRTAFLEILLLHICAEAYAQTGSLPLSYTFTYPLSMKRSEVDFYRAAAQRAVEIVEGLISPEAINPDGPQVNIVNESQAVFRAYIRSQTSRNNLRSNQRVVLVDMGGGSADYAVFGGSNQETSPNELFPSSQLCFLDSVVLAGNRFFEFLRDIVSDQEYTMLKSSLEKIVGIPSNFPNLSSLRDEPSIRLLRQFYTLRVVSMMPDKSPYFYQQRDLVSLEHKEMSVAEELSQKIDLYSPGHWMRSLFNIVLTHGLLLAIAPLPGQKMPTSIDVVLAGNGWGLLHHAGVVRSSTQLMSLVRFNYRRLKAVIEYYTKAGPAFVLPEESRIHVRFMDEIAADVLRGKGVYSKDIVAAGGILEGRGDDRITARGIIGFDLPVKPETNQRQQDQSSDGTIILPWYSSVAKEVVDALVQKEIEQRSAPGQSQDPFSKIKFLRLRADPSLLEPQQGSHSIPEQLLALELLKTGGFAGPPHEMLDLDQWEEWNTALFEDTGRVLDVYGEASSEQSPETTSLIRGVWEYPLLNRQVRRSLFRLMHGGS